MRYLIFFLYPWGLILQVVALVHFIRRRPDGYWLWVIFLGGGLGSLVYLVMEAAPDAKLLGGSFKIFHNRKRLQQLEWLVSENPAPANYEELGDLYYEEKNFARARECFDRAISARTDSPDPFYRRALCAVRVNDYAAAVPDLERVARADAKYDFYRAPALLAECYARVGQTEKADALFEQVTLASTLTQAQYNYAVFLANQGRFDKARQLANRALARGSAMPRFQRREEREWLHRTAALLKNLPRSAGTASVKGAAES